MSFSEVLAFLRAHDISGFAPALAVHDIISMKQLEQISESLLVEISNNRLELDKILAALGRRPMSRAVTPVPRRDLPTINTSTRGSLSKALLAAKPEFREESLNELHRNTYAATTTKSRDSRWRLWLQLTHAWDLDPLPLTVRSVNAVAASLRAGGYKSAKLLFSQARQQHVAETRTSVPPEVLLRMSQVERAVERGRGPSKIKDSFFVEDVARITDTNTEFPDSAAWSQYLRYRIDMVIICCWWLLRGIEAAAVMFAQAWTEVTHSGRTAFITLPCTKTDIVGLCVTRSHPCSCQRSKTLCPYHALRRHLDRMKELGYTDDSPLFPGRDGHPLQHHETTEIFRSVIHATGTVMTRVGPEGILLQRFCEHVCRVSGAQMLTRRGFPLDTVQLIGRWGSDAIKVYVQEAPLHRGDEHFRPPDISQPQQVREMVEHYLETLRQKFWVVNSVTKVVHLPGVSEISVDSTHWHTLCGWPYGLSPHHKEYHDPKGPRCERCFKLREAQEYSENQPDDED